MRCFPYAQRPSIQIQPLGPCRQYPGTQLEHDPPEFAPTRGQPAFAPGAVPLHCKSFFR